MQWKVIRKIGVVLIPILAMVIVILCKKDFYIDELLSYSLANNENGWMHFTDGETYMPANEIFTDQLSAKAGALFDYKNVWDNQAEDVHPPLYYAILHTVCSITPNKISVWQPAIINFIFVLLTMYILKKIMGLFFMAFGLERNKYDALSDFVVLLFGILPGILNNVSFFRMYVMAMFMVSWSSYLGIYIVKNIYENRTVVWKKWIEMFIASVCSALTHYYCILFLVLLQITLFIILVFKRKTKIIFQQLITEGLAAIMAIWIFPSMLNHIFSGYRGVEVQNNFVSVSISEYLNRLGILFSQINKGILGGGAAIIITMSVGVFVYKIVFCLKSINENAFRMKIAMTSILFIPCFAYFMILGKITIMLNQRYLSPIYAVVFVGSIIIMLYVLKTIRLNIMMSIIFLSVFLLAGAYRKPTWDYLYLQNTLINTMKDYEDIDAVVIYNDYWKCVETYKDLKNSKSVTFIKSNNLDLLRGSAIMNLSKVVIYSENEDDVIDISKEMNRPLECKKIGDSRYFTAYYLN